MTETDPRKDRILAAARDHFAAHGFEKTRLADVAKAADVAVGTIYLRYPGKAELLAGVLGEIEDRFAAAMDTPAIWALPWPERFQAVFRANLDLALSDPDLASLMGLAPFAMGVWRPGDRIRPMIVRHIMAGQASGALRPGFDPQIVAAIAYGMVEGALGELSVNPTAGPDQYLAQLTEAAQGWLLSRGAHAP